jgi:hypothetical protein
MGLIRESYIEVGNDSVEEKFSLPLEVYEVCDPELFECVEIIDDVSFVYESGLVFVLFCRQEGRAVFF